MHASKTNAPTAPKQSTAALTNRPTTLKKSNPNRPIRRRQVAERSLFLWNNEYIVSLVAQFRREVLPLVFGPLQENADHHWNPAVHGLTLNVRKMFMVRVRACARVSVWRAFGALWSRGPGTGTMITTTIHGHQQHQTKSNHQRQIKPNLIKFKTGARRAAL